MSHVHTMLLDGDALGITTNSTITEVFEAMKKIGISRQEVMFSHHVQICFGEFVIKHFKDRKHARCGFK